MCGTYQNFTAIGIVLPSVASDGLILVIWPFLLASLGATRQGAASQGEGRLFGVASLLSE